MTAGKVTLFAILSGAILATSTFAAYFEIFVPLASADNLNTSVTVLNTPPVWRDSPAGIGYAHETIESSTSTPTNIGNAITFSAIADDSNLDQYFLLICKTAGAPTPHANAPPTCNGGISNQWALSGTTTSGQVATSSTTTVDTVFWATEKNDWYGWVCDYNASLPKCNTLYTNGSESNYPNQSSPFVINHPPQFQIISNNSPRDPGASLSWTATATDTDHIRVLDPLTLFVCRTNGAGAFSTSTGSGCNGGAWATSTQSSTNLISTSTILSTPMQDTTYNAYVYVVDQNNLAATSTLEGSNSSFVVNNVAPTIAAGTASIVATSTHMTLYRPSSTSGPFTVNFIVTDNNSCLSAGLGHEISSASTSIYRSDRAAGCMSSTTMNENSCYPSADPTTHITCVQDTSGAITGNGCAGSSDATVGWVCTFELWSDADATYPDATTVYGANNWKATVQAVDDNYATSTQTETQNGTELDTFLAFDVTQTSIAYGSLQPGDSIDPLSVATTTNLLEQGNIGLDENLYGDTMCPNWLNQPDYCDHAWTDTGLAAATSTILASFQKFATDTVAYSAATALTSSSSPTLFQLHVLKTVSTSSPKTKDTLWAIKVPITITRAGDYSGVNTIIAAASNSAYW